jgi:hypothetical protein
MPSKANLAIYQGDDYAALVTVTDMAGQAVDLTGYSAQAQIRSGPADTNPVVMADITTAITANLITLTMPGSVTLPLAGRFVWDLQLVAPSGVTTTILAGAAIVTAEITRPAGARGAAASAA